MNSKPHYQLDPNLQADVLALFEAVQHGAVDAMVRLLDRNTPPNVEDEKGFRPLHLAAACGYAHLIEYLVIAGADLEAPHPGIIHNYKGWRGSSYDGFTALHFTVEGEQLEVARELLRCGANINAPHAWGQTPLRMAVETSGTCCVVSPTMARFFIEAGADVNARDNSGETILREAIRAALLSPEHQPSQEIIALLKERGALLN